MPPGFQQIGAVAVDSGQLVICDPHYIDSQWKRDTAPAAPLYKDTVDGTLWYCECHGESAHPNAEPFATFETPLPEYDGQVMNKLISTKRVRQLERGDPTGEFSYTGCCEMTTRRPGAGSLLFPMGHQGAGVAFSSGHGGGFYPVIAKIRGNVIEEVRIILTEYAEMGDAELHATVTTGEPATT